MYPCIWYSMVNGDIVILNYCAVVGGGTSVVLLEQ